MSFVSLFSLKRVIGSTWASEPVAQFRAKYPFDLRERDGFIGGDGAGQAALGAGAFQ